jgi:Starch binding domain
MEEAISNYTIKFTIKYQTNPGQNIYIYGNIDQLGSWKRNVCKLKWTEGHIWKGKINLNMMINSFEYKFVCASDDQSYKRWEDGINRVFIFDRSMLNEKKKIVLDCKWETFMMEFNIYYPLKNDCEYMQIVGGTKGIGNWLLDGGVPCRMKLSEPKQMGRKISFLIKNLFLIFFYKKGKILFLFVFILELFYL